ncbi:MCE family protein [Pseudonocardiaceae bacterium YIM PH 21723]|nr:MCE family protein [Pseudonocardiaceae bacterium YIM PH 21723]
MVLTRLVRVQLVVFAVLAVLSTAVVAQNYLGLSDALGIGRYRIRAEFTDAQGLFAGAPVTFRGVQVGKITGLELRATDAVATLDLETRTRIPQASRAEIRAVSAIGETYLDLVPERSTEPWLAEGEVIPISRTAGLSSSAVLLESANRLLATLPAERVNEVLGELNTAFAGSGHNLQILLGAASLLVHDASANVDPTRRLLAGLPQALNTQRQVAPQLRSGIAALSGVTGQLEASDPDIRRILDEGTPFVEQVLGLEHQLKPFLPILLGNLVSTGQVVRTYLPGLEQVLVLAPAEVAALQSVLVPYAGRGQAGVVLTLNINDPPICREGYEQPGDVYCKVAANDPRVVRGARNTPCLNAPPRRAATPAQCVDPKEPAWQRLLLK